MNEKEQLLENMSDEVDNIYEQGSDKEMSPQERLVKALIIDHIDRNYNNDNDPIIKAISSLENPLNDLYNIFESYIDTDRVFAKVFNDYFLKGQAHREIVADCMYCDEFYDNDEFCDDEGGIEEDDEGFIHDNEDC